MLARRWVQEWVHNFSWLLDRCIHGCPSHPQHAGLSLVEKQKSDLYDMRRKTSVDSHFLHRKLLTHDRIGLVRSIVCVPIHSLVLAADCDPLYNSRMVLTLCIDNSCIQTRRKEENGQKHLVVDFCHTATSGICGCHCAECSLRTNHISWVQWKRCDTCYYVCSECSVRAYLAGWVCVLLLKVLYQLEWQKARGSPSIRADWIWVTALR